MGPVGPHFHMCAGDTRREKGADGPFFTSCVWRAGILPRLPPRPVHAWDQRGQPYALPTVSPTTVTVTCAVTSECSATVTG